jgi:hypothetical protein
MLWSGAHCTIIHSIALIGRSRINLRNDSTSGFLQLTRWNSGKKTTASLQFQDEVTSGLLLMRQWEVSIININASLLSSHLCNASKPPQTTLSLDTSYIV